ncbi:MAG: hypothetical protein HS115_04340 [Spirochaetales bacterium]|nr:hypothetical protein [Spirochaetales bacterium]
MSSWFFRPDRHSVLIISARGPLAGSGHAERCRILARYLKSQGIEVREAALDLQSGRWQTDTLEDSFALIVLDARDFDPARIPFTGPILALDNQSASRGRGGRFSFYDTIPHPQLDLSIVLRQALVEPIPYRPHKSQVLIYSGALTVPRYVALLLDVLRPCPVLVVGTPGPLKARYIRRLSPEAFRQELGRSSYFLTYFGQSFLESLSVRGLRPLLYSSGSDYHDLLSSAISRQLKIPFVRNLSDALSCRMRIATYRPRIWTVAGGYDLLTERIKRLLSAGARAEI